MTWINSKNQEEDFMKIIDSTVPGPIAFKTEEIVNIIRKGIKDIDNINEFLEKYLENCDGNSTKRLYHLLMET